MTSRRPEAIINTPSATITTVRLGVSRKADAWDEEYQSYLLFTLIDSEQRNIDVSRRPGERFPGGLMVDKPFQRPVDDIDSGKLRRVKCSPFRLGGRRFALWLYRRIPGLCAKISTAFSA